MTGTALYRKVIRYTGSITSGAETNIGSIGTFNEVVAINYAIKNSSGTRWYYNAGAGNNTQFKFWVETSNGNVYFQSINEAWGSPVLNVEVIYTKN